MASSWGLLGDIERNRGNLDQAEQLYNQSMRLREELNSLPLIAQGNYDLAQLHRAKGNPALAQTHYATAHRLFTQLGAAKDLERIEKEWADS